MKGSDILKLAKAGFSIEQIVQIDDALGLPGDPDVAAAAPADQVPIEPKPEEPKPEEPKPEEPKPESEAATAIKAATATLVDTLEKIQRANVTGLPQPAREEETADSILASLITGPQGQKKEG